MGLIKAKEIEQAREWTGEASRGRAIIDWLNTKPHGTGNLTTQYATRPGEHGEQQMEFHSLYVATNDSQRVVNSYFMTEVPSGSWVVYTKSGEFHIFTHLEMDEIHLGPIEERQS